MVHLLADVLGRPNALDTEVNAIPVHALLTGSPYVLADAARAAAAARLEEFRTIAWPVSVALQIIVLAWFWSTGYSGRLRDWLRERAGSEFGVRFIFGAFLAALARVAALVPNAAQYRFMRLMDLNDLLFRTWLAHWLAGTLVTMAVVGLTAAIVLGLADRTHQWYLYTIAGVMAFTLLIAYVSPIVIAPLTTAFTPLNPSGAMVRDTTSLERSTGTSLLFVEERLDGRSRLGASYVLGWDGTERAVISDTEIAGSTPEELRFYAARSIAWAQMNLGLQTALVQAAFIVVGAALSVLLADRIGFRRDDDPVSRLALLGAVIGCVYLIALPFYNSYARHSEIAADQAAVAITGDRAAAVRAQVREADQALQRICPGRFAYWFSSGPSAGERIAFLQDRPDVCATPHL